MQIEPQSTIPLVYLITDPLDTALYYIQAVIRDSSTGSILATKNLSRVGSTGRYTSSVQAPQDTLGQGRHIDVTISVYTDSGYSSYSDMYQIKIDKYMVKKATTNFFGGAGGVDVNYDKIRSIVDETVSKRLGDVKSKKTSLKGVYEVLGDIQDAIEVLTKKEIKFPEQKEVDLSGVMNAVKAAQTQITKTVEGKIDGIDIPKTDLQPVLDAVAKLETMSADFDATSKASVQAVMGMKNEIEKLFKNMETSMNEKGKRMQEVMKAAIDDGAMFTPPVPEKKSSVESPYKQYFKK